MLKRLLISLLFVPMLFAQGGPGQSNYPVSQITLEQGGTVEGSVNGNVTINYVSGCTVSVSGSVASITCSGGGSGTVSANNGSAGALATYAAAAGSTTVGPDAGMLSNGSGTLTLGAVGVGSGALILAGTTSGTGTLQCAAAACTALSLNIGFNANANLAIGGHLNQTAAGKYAGSCAMVSATTCTFSIATTFTNYLSFVSVDHASVGSLTVANSCGASLSSTTVTITCAVSNSLTWDALLIGNPS
jgi:hypothetical protein